jgi:hypothetical protein
VSARVQLSRARGWRMPADAIKIDRSTEWGNPFRIVGPMRHDGGKVEWWVETDTSVWRFPSKPEAQAAAVKLHRAWIMHRNRVFIGIACASASSEPARRAGVALVKVATVIR